MYSYYIGNGNQLIDCVFLFCEYIDLLCIFRPMMNKYEIHRFKTIFNGSYLLIMLIIIIIMLQVKTYYVL